MKYINSDGEDGAEQAEKVRGDETCRPGHYSRRAGPGRQDQDIWRDDNSYVTKPHKIISNHYIRNVRLLLYSFNIIISIRHQDQ